MSHFSLIMLKKKLTTTDRCSGDDDDISPFFSMLRFSTLTRESVNATNANVPRSRSSRRAGERRINREKGKTKNRGNRYRSIRSSQSSRDAIRGCDGPLPGRHNPYYKYCSPLSHRCVYPCLGPIRNLPSPNVTRS